MYRLLIVDDEPVIVNGLVELFSEPNDLNLEIYWAYSSFEAIERLTKTKMDIVLSDIRMPLKSGLELQKEIMLQWPRCKVIFLTGYNDFAHVQEAMRNGSIDYVLKTEGDEKLLETVEKAIVSLKKEVEIDHLIQEAKRHILRALPSLQQEFLWDLLQGDSYSLQTMPKQFSDLQIRLDADAPVLLVLGRVDNWKQDISPSDRLRLLYAIQNIAEEYMSVSSSVFSIVYDRSKLVWMIQPQIQDNSNKNSIEESWKRTILFIHGMLELLQSTCKDLLNLPISFVAASEPVAWKGTAEKFEALKSVFSQGFGMSTELYQVNELTVKGNEYITKVEGYIRQNVSGDLSLACIGEAVGLNPSYLSRLYKQVTGQGLSSLITEVRMMKAKAMLQDKKYKIHEISKHVGFVSDHHFYRFFKKAMHMTPQEYRESVN